MLIHFIKSRLAALGAGLALAASGLALAADPGISDTTITLGMSAPFSGPNEAYGKEMKEGALAYFAQLNAAGGINGRKVELIAIDDGYETERTVANTRKLINEHIVRISDFIYEIAVSRSFGVILNRLIRIAYTYIHKFPWRRAAHRKNGHTSNIS